MAGKENIVVSHRARGICLFNAATFLDFKAHLVAIFLSILDLFIAALITVSLLSWNGYIGFIITLIVACAGGYEANTSTGLFDCFLFFFAYIVLPAILLLAYVLLRCVMIPCFAQ